MTKGTWRSEAPWTLMLKTGTVPYRHRVNNHRCTSGKSIRKEGNNDVSIFFYKYKVMFENTEKVWGFCQSWSVSTCGTEWHDIPGAKELLGFKKGLDIHKDAKVSMSTGGKHANPDVRQLDDGTEHNISKIAHNTKPNFGNPMRALTFLALN